MATQNRISAVLTDADKIAILTAIIAIKTKLPFLISLSPKERKSLRKAASKRQGYVSDVADGVKAFPSAMPGTFPTAEYLKDANLYVPMGEILPAIMGLALTVEDTRIQLGSELITASDNAYASLKNAARLDSNVKPAVEKIGAGLKRKTAIKIAP